MDRYSSKVGQEVDLFLYLRDADGLRMNAYSVGQVYVYRNNPDVAGANTIMASVYGSVNLNDSKSIILDGSLTFTDYDIKVGNYLEVKAGNNKGFYKIKAVSEDYIEIDGSFSVTESAIDYKVVMLMGIFTPLKEVEAGTYKIHFYIPEDWDGGTYYDYWTDIKMSPSAAPMEKTQNFYVAKDIPYYVNSSEKATDRYMAYQGGVAYLDMEFRARPNYMPYDPFSIEDIVIYRLDPTNPSAPVGPLLSSVNGEIDASDTYLFRDTTVDFYAPINHIKRYDTLVVTAPASVEGRYRISEVVDANNLKVISPFSLVTTGITYTIEPYYYLGAKDIVQQEVGVYAKKFNVPDDFIEDHYWDSWSYYPGDNVLSTQSIQNYDNPGDYFLSNPADIVVAGSMLSLITPLPGGHLTRRPYAYQTNTAVLGNPESLNSVMASIVTGSKGDIEYSILYNGTDLWFDGTNWITNTGSLVKGDELWDDLISVWHMSGDWTDGKRNNNGVRFGTGVEFGVSGYLDGVSGLFNGTDDYIRIPYSTTFNMGYSGMTIPFLVKTSAVVEQVIAMQAFSNDAALGGPGWVLKLQATGELVIMFGTDAQGSAMTELVGTVPVNDGVEHLVVVALGNSADSFLNDVTVYIDGVIADYYMNGGIGGKAFGGFVYDVVIGADYHQGAFDQGFFSGTLKELALIKGSLDFTRASRLTNNITQNKHSISGDKLDDAFLYLKPNNGDSVVPVVYIVEAYDRFGVSPMDVEDVTMNWDQYVVGPLSKAIGDVYVKEAVYDDEPGRVNTCTVIGRIVELDGSPVPNVKLTVYGMEKPWNAGGSIAIPKTIEAETDNGGYFSFRVIQDIKVWMSIPWLNYRKKVTIPRLTRINWLDLEAEEEI